MQNDIHLLENKNILVIGGAGFVGNNLVKLLLKEEDKLKITIVDNLLSSEKENIPNDHRIFFIEGSITDDNILSRIKDEYHYIFHIATYHGNQSSIHNPLKDHENNTLTTLKILNHIKEFSKLIKFVYSSAGCSVAKKTFEDVRATTEDDPIEIRQDSPYSISKIIGEFYSVYFFNQFNVPTVRARFQNVYGPGEILGAGRWRGTPATVWRNVTPTFIYKALKKQPLPLENEGKTSRDFIFVEDICRGLLQCALIGKPGDVYNLASGSEMTIKGLAEIINDITGNQSGIINLPGRIWDHSGRRYGSTKKAMEELNFQTKIEIREGLKRTINWTLENIDIIEKNINKHSNYLQHT